MVIRAAKILMRLTGTHVHLPLLYLPMLYVSVQYVYSYKCMLFLDMQDKRKDAVLYLLYEEEWESITTHIDQSAVIVSHNFPFHYVIGGMWAWDISFQGSSYINMIVYNMSLSTYTVICAFTPYFVCFKHY